MALTNLTKVQTVGIGSNIEVVGVVTTGQFKSGTSNLHSTGIELTNLNVSGIATIGGNLSIGGTLTYEDVTNIDSIGIITARAGVNVSGGQLDVGSNIKLGNAGVITATSFSGSGANLTGITGTTINNNSDNRVITGSGTANTLEGESALTFSGQTLSVYGAAGDPGRIQLKEGGAVSQIMTTRNSDTNGDLRFSTEVSGSLAVRAKINYSGDFEIPDKIVHEGDTNTAIRFPENDTVTVETTGTQTFRINSSGYLDLGRDYSSNPQNGLVGITTIRGHRVNEAGDYSQLFFKNSSVSGASSSSIRAFRDGGNFSTGLKFYTHSSNSSGGDGVERFKIDKDGKLYKGGNQFYPLVNYSEVTTFSAAAVSSSSYTDLRTILSGYTPKKAGNRIVIHHQSQMWNGAAASANGDVYWKIQRQEGGGSWTDTVKNERILGNHDGHSYTGGSGLARHHRTVHLMGSFICAGTSINLKTQGRSIGISWDWYHDGNNVLQIWEYDIS